VLSIEEWEAATGDAGGLTPGAPYFQSATAIGEITKDAPITSGSFVSQVGIAATPTTLILSTPSLAIDVP